jgi:glycosyltransferase involved in cell wall biosynthesis
MANILWVPHVAWKVPQRPHHFIPHLSDRHRFHVTNWDASFTTLPALLSRDGLQNLVPRSWQEGAVRVHHVPRISPALPFGVVRHFNASIYRHALDQVIDRHRIDAVVGTFVAPPPHQKPPAILDLFDDNPAYWREKDLVPEYADEIRRHEDAWAEISRAIVCVSSVMRDRAIDERGYPKEKIHVIPNGVDLERYLPTADPETLKASLGLNPAMRYVGVIGSLNKLDEVARIIAVGRRLKDVPNTRLLVVGQGTAVPALLTQARDFQVPLRYEGFQTGPRLIQYFQTLTVGLCPYTKTLGADAGCPMRLLHYSAVGSTVVSTALTEVTRMGFSNVLCTADDPDTFAETVLFALNRPDGARPPELAAYDAKALSLQYDALIRSALTS